jgi:hypothetical protein
MPAGSVNPTSMLRVSAYLIEQIYLAKVVIAESGLAEEAKAGVNSALKALELAFSLGNITNPMAALYVNAPTYISSFVILLSASGISTEEVKIKEADDLAADIRNLIKEFEDVTLDPVVRDIARKHLSVLETLLRQIKIFGLEPALSIYWDLMLKLRRADVGSSAASKAALNPLFETIKKWGERMGAIDKAVNSGANLLERVGGAKNLLEYIPAALDNV